MFWKLLSLKMVSGCDIMKMDKGEKCFFFNIRRFYQNFLPNVSIN